MSRSKERSKRVRRFVSNALYLVGGVMLLVSFIAILLIECIGSSGDAPDVPPLTGRVVDLAGAFPPAGSAAVEAEIKSLEDATGGGQMAVLAVTTLGDTPIEEYSLKVAESWKIGRKGKDDGAILVIAVEDHKDRLEIGRGWEGPVNDARAGDILRAMVPYLRANDYAGAAILAVRSVRGFVTGDKTAAAPEPVDSDAPGEVASPTEITTGLAFFLSLFLLAAAAGFDPDKPAGSSSSGGGSGGGYSSGGGSSYSGGGGSYSGGGASGSW